MSIADREPPYGRYEPPDIGTGRVLSEIPRPHIKRIILEYGGSLVAVDQRIVIGAHLGKRRDRRLAVVTPSVIPVIKEKRDSPPQVCTPFSPEELEARTGEIAKLDVGLRNSITGIYVGDRYYLRFVELQNALELDLQSTDPIITERRRGSALRALEDILPPDKY